MAVIINYDEGSPIQDYSFQLIQEIVTNLFCVTRIGLADPRCVIMGETTSQAWRLNNPPILGYQSAKTEKRRLHIYCRE